MSAFETGPEPENGNAPPAWPAAEPLFPVGAAGEPRTADPAREETSPIGLAPPRKRSVARGTIAVVQLLLVVVLMATFVAALLAGALLLLTMALRAAVT